MSLGAFSQEVLLEGEAVTGLPVQTDMVRHLKAPLLARVQIARGGLPLYKVTCQPNAHWKADHLTVYQRAFVLRLRALPTGELFDLADTEAPRSESLRQTKAHPASAGLPGNLQATFAELFRTSLVSILRSKPLGLNQVAGESLPRNADGVNPEALEAMIGALKRLRAMTTETAQQLTLQAALLGQNGLRLEDPARTHRLEGIPQPLSGLEVACLIHAGVQLASPGSDSGLPLVREFQFAASQVDAKA